MEVATAFPSSFNSLVCDEALARRNTSSQLICFRRVSIRSYAMRPSRGDAGQQLAVVSSGFNSLVCDEALAR